MNRHTIEKCVCLFLTFFFMATTSYLSYRDVNRKYLVAEKQKEVDRVETEKKALLNDLTYAENQSVEWQEYALSLETELFDTSSNLDTLESEHRQLIEYVSICIQDEDIQTR